MLKRHSLFLIIKKLAAPAAMALSFSATVNAVADQTYTVNIARQDAGSALMALARVTGAQIIVPKKAGKIAQVETLQGEYTLNAALASLLVGTGLEYEITPGNVVLVKMADDKPGAEEKGVKNPGSSEATEEIVVTGSRIKRTEFSSVSPIQVLGGEESRKLGQFTAEDVLSQSSVLQGEQTTIGLSSSTMVDQNYGFNKVFTTFGSTTPSLRGLTSTVSGRARSLILVNDRRLGAIGVGGAPGNPDISFIPGTLIERAEILLDGASSIYGSDAIAGVINYKLDTDFEGFQINASYDTPEIRVGDASTMSMKWGASNDRGRIVVAGEYRKKSAVDLRSRMGKYLPHPDGILCLPDMEHNRVTGEVFSDTCAVRVISRMYTPSGLAGGGRQLIRVNPDEIPTNVGISGWFAPDKEVATTQEWFTNWPSMVNPTQFDQHITPQTEQYSIYAAGEYSFDSLPSEPTMYFDVSYGSRDLYSIYSGGAFEYSDGDNPIPYSPFGDASIGAAMGFPVRLETNQDLHVFRTAVGVRGDLPFMEVGSLKNWTYDSYVQFHRSSGLQTTYGDLNMFNFRRALNGTVNESGNLVCAGDEIGIGACPNINLFDYQFMMTGRFASDEFNNFLLANTSQETTVDQTIVSGYITGDLFENPLAGAVSAVLGFEHRSDQVETVNDNLTQTPDALRFGRTDIGSNGEKYVNEIFAELSIPILANKPGIESLSAESAFRYTDDEYAGHATTWQQKLEYAPVNWLRFSGGYGTSFRAPDTGELFGAGIVYNAFNYLVDGCVAFDPTNLSEREFLQLSDGTNNPPGVPDGVWFFDPAGDGRPQVTKDLCSQVGYTYPTGPLDAENVEKIFGYTGIGTDTLGTGERSYTRVANLGSFNVQPETSRSFFAKMVFDQPWSDAFNLQVSVSYFDIELNNQISQLTAGVVMNSCLTSPSTQFVGGSLVGPLCEFISRDPATGRLIEVNEASANAGSITSRGIDYDIHFATDLPFLKGVFGNDPVFLDMRARVTQSLENSEDIGGTGDFVVNLGYDGFPKIQSNLTTALTWNNWTLMHRWTFKSNTDTHPLSRWLANTGEGVNCNAASPEPRDCYEYVWFPEVTLHDLSLSYNTGEWGISMGIKNLFDKVAVGRPGIVQDGLSGTPAGWGFDMDGRNFYLNLSMNF